MLDNFLAMFRLHRESNLLACVTDDFSISIVDIDNRYSRYGRYCIQKYRICSSYTHRTQQCCGSGSNRIGSGFSGVRRPWIRIQKVKMSHKNRKKLINFIF